MKVLAILMLFAMVALAYSVPWAGHGYGRFGSAYGYKIAHPLYSVSHYGYAPVHGYLGGHGGYGGYGGHGIGYGGHGYGYGGYG
ncbi:unnamed protein product, partial [Oppiella nova]